MAPGPGPEPLGVCERHAGLTRFKCREDLAKMAQLIPVVGAPIGAVVNWRLIDRLGETAMMACRMRWLGETG